MDDLDKRLANLITQLQQAPPQTSKWRSAMNYLLREIQQLPGLVKSSHPDYPTALNLTLVWVSHNIANFQLRSSSVSKSLEIWINGYHRWRIKDLYAPDKDAAISLDAPIQEEAGERTLLEQIPAFTLSGLDGLIENNQKETTQRIGLELEVYIEQDPEENLKNSYPRSYPECNCQFLSKRRILKEPPDKFADVARELNIKYTTVNSHWQRKCQPLLQEIAKNLGYQQEQQ